MYLHIGKGQSIKENDILGIFDLDTSTVSKNTKRYISRLEKEGRIEYTDYDLPRSFIVYGKAGDMRINLSRISSSGLNQRLENEFKDYNE